MLRGHVNYLMQKVDSVPARFSLGKLDRKIGPASEGQDKEGDEVHTYVSLSVVACLCAPANNKGNGRLQMRFIEG